MTLTSAARCQPVWPGDRGSEGLPAGAGGAQRPVLSVRVGGGRLRAHSRGVGGSAVTAQRTPAVPGPGEAVGT